MDIDPAITNNLLWQAIRKLIPDLPDDVCRFQLNLEVGKPPEIIVCTTPGMVGGEPDQVFSIEPANAK